MITDELAENDFDIFAITESRHESSDDVALKRITPEGYSCLDKARESCNRRGKKTTFGGGVALIFKNSFHSKMFELDFRTNEFEFLAVMLTLGGQRILSIVLYRPGSRPLTDAFLEDFSKFLELLIVQSCHILILGDINIHLDVPDDGMTVKFGTIMECFGMKQHINQPTHKAGHTLDILITKSSMPPPSRMVINPPTFSDHSLIMATFSLGKPQPISFNATTRAWSKLDKDSFRKDLRDSLLCSDVGSWNDASCDDMADIYQETMEKLLEKHAPLRQVRRHYRPITPWFNSECRAMKRKTRCFERRYRRSRLETDRNSWLSQMRSGQEFYKRVQDMYWQTLVDESSGNARKLWNTMSTMMGSKRRSPVQPDLSADIFLRAFCDKVDDVRSATAGSGDPRFSDFKGIHLLQFSIISLDETRRLLMGAPVKSCALDPVPTWLVKDHVDELAPFIRTLFNKSLSTGCFPSSFRRAEITPILKKSSLDASVPGNYRPISNLCFLSKLLERVANEQLLDHLRSNNLIPEHQSAYRKSHSTENSSIEGDLRMPFLRRIEEWLLCSVYST